MFESSVIRITGQWWKLIVALFLVIGGGTAVAFGPAEYSPLLVIIGAAIALAGFCFACITIRCPSCGKRWFWEAVSTQSHREWLSHVLGREDCPSCGSTGEVSDAGKTTPPS